MAENLTKGGTGGAPGPEPPGGPTYIYVDINYDFNFEVEWAYATSLGALLSITITSTGCSFLISYDGGGEYTPSPWTYSGTATFAGFSITSGATEPDSGLAVGDTYTQSISPGGTIYLILYPVETISPEPVQYITTDEELTSIANAIRSKGGTSAQLVYPTGFVTAIGNISTGSGTVQSSKSYTVSGSGSATISPDIGYDTMAAVALTVPSGSAGTPTATKGSVSNHAISVTPSVTNTSGYITGSTKTGTAVAVSASELVSGNYVITSNGNNIDVTNYATVSVNVSGGSSTLKVGVIRPDAELIQTWSDDFWLVSDKSKNIPTYSTSNTTILSSQDIATVTVDVTNYVYFLTISAVTYPTYSISTRASGRWEWQLYNSCQEQWYIPTNTYKSISTPVISGGDLVGSTSYSRNDFAYFRNASTLGWTTSAAGIFQTFSQLATFYSDGVKLVLKTPSVTAKGDAANTTINSTFYDAITDVRCQYIYKLWRVPIGSSAGIEGWNHWSWWKSNIDLLNSSSHTIV